MRPGEVDTLSFTFERQGVKVGVEAELRVNDDPALYGCPDCARGFPVMRATVAPPARGYQDMLGWIQLVRGPDWGGVFRIDHFEPLGDPVHFPFGFFGFAPVAIDAPHRDTYPDMEWTAHTFLAGTAGIHHHLEARAGLGFSWGYEIRDGEIGVVGLAELGPEDWDAHVPVLRANCPAWTYGPGFALGAD